MAWCNDIKNLGKDYLALGLWNHQIELVGFCLMQISPKTLRAVVVAQLADRWLPTPEIRGSNPDISNISNIFICQLLSRKDENKEKEAGNGPLKKKVDC